MIIDWWDYYIVRFHHEHRNGSTDIYRNDYC